MNVRPTESEISGDSPSSENNPKSRDETAGVDNDAADATERQSGPNGDEATPSDGLASESAKRPSEEKPREHAQQSAMWPDWIEEAEKARSGSAPCPVGMEDVLEDSLEVALADSLQDLARQIAPGESERKETPQQKTREERLEEAIGEAWAEAVKKSFAPSEEVAKELDRPMTLWVACCCADAEADVASALDLSVAASPQKTARGNVISGAKTKKEEERKTLIKKLLNAGKSVVLLLPPGDACSFAMANKTRLIDCKNASSRLAQTALSLEAAGFAKTTPSGQKLSELLASLQVPAERTPGALSWMEGVCRSEGPLSERELADLDVLLSKRLLNRPSETDGAPAALSEVAGLSPLVRQELSRLARKLRADKPLSQGALLWGPPGTGKTMLSKILAAESGREFVHGSYPEWQAAGSLDDHLAAMRATFADAVANAPSVLFIDEIDSVGLRNAGSPNDSYMNIVVNAMLELTQSAIASNVAIIAATNYPRSIDPALTRPGRLGHWVEIPNPDRQGREEILSQLLAGSDIDCESMARRTGDCSPAKLKALVSEAKEIAAERDAPVCEESDIGSAFQQEVARQLGRRKWSKLVGPLAVGLCSQARMRWLAQGDEAQIEALSLEPGLVDLARIEWSHQADLSRTTAADIMSQLHCALAPAAGRQAFAQKKVGQGLADVAMDALATLNEEEREEALRLARELVGTGAAGRSTIRDGANAVESKNGAHAEAVTATLRNAWEIVMRSTRRGLPGIEQAAALLMREGWVSEQRMREALFGDDPEAPQGLLH
jgi:hypothetical protein